MQPVFHGPNAGAKAIGSTRLMRLNLLRLFFVQQLFNAVAGF
jgi:hypothetical protein